MSTPLDTVLGVVAVKACVAVLLALAAAAAERWTGRPSLVHALWLVVLLELLVPPLVEVGVLPAPDRAVAAATPPLALTRTASATAEAGAGPGAGRLAPLPMALGAAWALGSAACLLLAAVRFGRFARCVRGATDAPAELRAAAARLGARLGLARSPRIRVVEARVSPMLRPGLGSIELLFPTELLARLSAAERDTLLAHELAHVRRRDHWVRWVELAAGTLFWWLPLVAWARARLRRAEERCCDALVLDALPGHAHAYATGLVKTVEFLAGSRAPLPAGACGAGTTHPIRERLTMILESRPPRSLTRLQRVALALVAGAVLVVLPTRAARPPQEAARDEHEARLSAHDVEARERMLALERRAHELESELRAVRAQQRTVEIDLARQHGQVELARLEAHADAVEAAGDLGAAERVRQERIWAEQRLALESEHQRLEVERAEEFARLEETMRLAALEAEAARGHGDAAGAEALARDAARMEVRMQGVSESELRLQQLELDLARSAADGLRREIEMLAAAGHMREADELRRELDAMRGEIEAFGTHRRTEDERRELQRQIEALRADLERAAAAGRENEAAKLEREIEALRRALEAREAAGGAR